jgi:hypothetical protein
MFILHHYKICFQLRVYLIMLILTARGKSLLIQSAFNYFEHFKNNIGRNINQRASYGLSPKDTIAFLPELKIY